MKLRILSVAFCTAVLAASIQTAPAGLYDDEAQKITTGDIMDQDYWFAKFDQDMLELALKQHQPEGRIGFNLDSAIGRLKELVKKYPKHEELPKWLAHDQEVSKKINPDAQRGTALNAGCPWEESNYVQLWVNWHYGKMLLEAKDYEKARTILGNVMQNYGIMLKGDRMKDYPEDLRKWVEDSKAEADKMYAQAKEKTHG